MAQPYSNSVDRSLAQLPEDRREAAAAEAWRLFQSSTLTWAEAAAFVVTAELARPAQPMGQRIAAARKVVLIESATRPGVVHQVVNGRCTCEAARYGRPCWHLKAARQAA